MLTLTLSHFKGLRIDIQVNQEQILKDTLVIIMSKGLLPPISLDKIVLQSERSKKRLNLELSYEENEIYMGDILTIL